FDRSKQHKVVPDTAGAPVRAPSTITRAATSQQITLPYDASTQITKEYPPPPVLPARLRAGEIMGAGKPAAHLVEEPDIDVTWNMPDQGELTAVERALAELGVDGEVPVPETPEVSQRLATGSSPVALDGAPIVQPERKRPLPRPSMKQQFAAE